MTAIKENRISHPSDSSNLPSVGVVAIGRNEGDRLRRCLHALHSYREAIVYVDSGSTDGSCELARSLGVDVVELDTSIPFTAARARNAGFERLIGTHPLVEFVQFVDGDCEIVDGWLETAAGVMSKHSEVAVVCGRRRERYPNATLYNRIADLEWDTPIGRTQACGGDALMRVSALTRAGGFDESIAAGEEPELCGRLRNEGGQIERIDTEMTLHDAAVSRFSQWWKRHLRSGYGGLDVRRRLGVRLFDRELSSARRWTVGWVLLTVALSALLAWRWGAIGALLGGAIGSGLWVLQTLRITQAYSRRGLNTFDAAKAAGITMLVKWANLVGQLQYLRDNRAGRIARLIEYKTVPPHTPTTETCSVR